MPQEFRVTTLAQVPDLINMAQSAYVACAENISLLHLLQKVPEPPSVNIAPPIEHDATNYTLELATERSLAGALAFVSSITDSPKCITAVCIQEQEQRRKLQVHVAINKKSPTENDGTLGIICSGFNQMFARLSDFDGGNCENDLCMQIVSLCRSKILCRLGYQKKTAFGCRSPLDTVLDRARESLLQLREGVQVPKMDKYHRNASTMSAQVEQFLDKSADLVKVIRSWTMHKTDNELCAVIDGLYDFVATDKWKTVIELIPERLMDCSSRQSLVKMLQKGSRYRHIARLLYRAAKKHPIIRRMEAVAVQLPEHTFQRASPSSPPSSLEGTSSRVLAAPNHSVDRLCQALNTNADEARTVFEAQTHKTLTEGKFHAEVQLLCQILSQPSHTPPRVVCASKDACFLCNCLLRAHAKLYTPRCHGKLYPAWRLPMTAEFRPLQVSLNQMLEQRIRSSAAAAFLQSVGGGRQRRGRRQHLYPDPCESSCSTAMRSDTTVVVKTAGSADGGTLEDGSSASENSVAKDDSVPSKTSCSSSSMASLRAAEESERLMGEDATALMEKDDSLDTSSSSDTATPVEKEAAQSLVSRDRRLDGRHWTVSQSYALAQGEVVASSIPPNTASKTYTAELLRVQLEYTNTRHRAGDDDDDDDDQTHLKYQIQQLTAHEARTLREGRSSINIIDVSAITASQERTSPALR
ncbi:arginine N-methyltransferase 2-like protein [Beauveria brongniartii RCEF 3172]|uniref:Arginine N-methyltransferase 2-like protein n=1 Tax=Beauveria brongniartii RCEF 3172 TaxID=1081107 RepID=A0A162JKS4_9HYPO|nr:arginine N-methyltransferase 2-like protein [Beauveria brongniartii RCEF 3172]